MTTTITFPQFTAQMRQVAADLAGIEHKVAQAAAGTVKSAVQTRLRIAAPRGRLNVGKRGKRVGVRYTIFEGTARVFMTGPAQLIESDTQAHRIPRERKRSRKRVVLAGPNFGPVATVNHPGTKGKHPWSKGVSDAAPDVPKAAAKVYFDTFRKHLG